MTRDGGIRNVGQAELAEHALLFLLGPIASWQAGRNPSSASSRISSRVMGLERAADQRGARADNSDFTRRRSVRAKQCLLCRRALTAKRAALTKRKSFAELRFGQPGDGQIEVVAAQQKMAANVGAGKLDAIAFAIHTHQREVTCAAADIAHEHHLAVE